MRPLSNSHKVFILIIACSLQPGIEHTACTAFYSVLGSAKAALESDPPDEQQQHLNPYSIYFTDLLKDVVIPLLERTGPSHRVVMLLEKLATVIRLLCLYLERRGFSQEAEKVGLTVQRYLSESAPQPAPPPLPSFPR